MERATLSGPRIAVLVLAWCLAGTPLLIAQYQQDPPDFSGSDYGFPTPAHPEPPSALRHLLDAGVLAAGLGLSAWLVLRRRSRAGSVLLGIGSIAWFGFIRHGCVCPIGGIQNVALALADPRYAVSLTILLVVLLPLAAALLFGRVFCGGVCPHGAVQDLVLLRPIRVPRMLDRALGTIKYVYLAAAVWLAGWGLAPFLSPGDDVTQASRRFIICEYDPFVGIFRLSGPVGMIVLGAAFLVAGTFIGRPYCRWLCPYGALLAIASRVGWKGLRITPDKELDCGLCSEACPFGAIEEMRAVKANCLSCARCYESCPREHERRKAREKRVQVEVAAHR